MGGGGSYSTDNNLDSRMLNPNSMAKINVFEMFLNTQLIMQVSA